MPRPLYRSREACLRLYKDESGDYQLECGDDEDWYMAIGMEPEEAVKIAKAILKDAEKEAR